MKLSQTSLVAIIIAFIAYLLFMIVIGAICMKRTKNTEDYFLGGRGLGSWVAALSAQASDMSGWLLMGLPGSIYALGTGQSWIAVGLFLGTVANWLLISKRLRRYTIIAGNAMTLPEFFEHRYHDKKKILLTISSVVIVIFFLVYTASALASGGKLFNTVFGIDYHVALAIGALVILVYTFMGGFLAVCTTDFVQGSLMLIGLLSVPILAFSFVGGDFAEKIASTNVAGGYHNYLSLVMNGDRPYTFVEILSQLAWGLGYCGMPHILVRFMAIKSEKEVTKSSAIAIVWCFLSLVAACFIGIIGRAYLAPEVLTDTEGVFIQLIERVFTKNIAAPFIGGIFLCGILAAIMSTADSQLLVCASSVSKDIFKNLIKRDADDKTVLNTSRITVLVVAVLAFLIAWNPNSSIMGLVSDAWAGLGAAFGPAVVCALFWKRTNLPGTVAGIVSGGLTVIIWDYLPIIGGQTIGAATGIYSLLVGFFISLLMIVVVSLCTQKPDAIIVEEFEKVKNYTEG
ncbi:MAG: sodium/proline symporter PutP [Eubacteriales bacterium]|nr:sodium/proline symporter PutP [Eubacteriales bacterium]